MKVRQNGDARTHRESGHSPRSTFDELFLIMQYFSCHPPRTKGPLRACIRSLKTPNLVMILLSYSPGAKVNEASLNPGLTSPIWTSRGLNTLFAICWSRFGESFPGIVTISRSTARTGILLSFPIITGRSPSVLKTYPNG